MLKKAIVLILSAMLCGNVLAFTRTTKAEEPKAEHISRAALYFNLIDLLRGAVSKEYLEANGSAEFDISNNLTLGTKYSYIKDKLADTDNHSVGVYFDYRIHGDRDNQWFIRNMFMLTEKPVEPTVVSTSVPTEYRHSNHKTYPGRELVTATVSNGVKNVLDYTIAAGRKHYFDNNLCLQYGAGLTTNKNKLSIFSGNSKFPFDAMLFVKIGAWIAR
jgi:hypothetical protein